MAKNLRTKIPSSDTMYIHDVNPAVTESCAKEIGNVTIANNVREVAENSVCTRCTAPEHCYDEYYCFAYDLSWQRKLCL